MDIVHGFRLTFPLLVLSLWCADRGLPGYGAVLARQTPAAATSAADLAAARASLAAGRVAEALSRVEAVVARAPADGEAARLKISILLDRQQFDPALAAYDAYTAALHKPDLGALALIGRARLTWIARSLLDQPTLIADALERLARHGDADALARLQRMSASAAPGSAEALESTLGLVRLGDSAAEARLGAALASAPPELKASAILALQRADARSQAPKIAAELADGDPAVRATAALALGVLQDHDAVKTLRALFDNDVPIVHMYAGVALKRLGETSVDAYVADLLHSAVPDVRLMAAEAYTAASSTQWVPLVRELRTERNDMVRMKAADRLACCDVAAARAILLDALNSPNPLLRAEAARIFESRHLADPNDDRRLLGDSFELVRLYGAGAVLAAAAPPVGK